MIDLGYANTGRERTLWFRTLSSRICAACGCALIHTGGMPVVRILFFVCLCH